MATDPNPYQAYTDGSVFSDNPLNLVITLYQGALDATKQAERALRAGDILGRGKGINKANAVLAELLMSLDHQKGGEISHNLRRLYCYMQVQLSGAHARQSVEPLIEVASLLNTLLEGWRGAAQVSSAASPIATEKAPRASTPLPAALAAPDSTPYYGGYLDDSAAARGYSAYSF